jgi:hypothetical protein
MRETMRSVGVSVASLVLLLAHCLPAQHTAPGKTPQTPWQDQLLSVPIRWADASLHLFKDSDAVMIFKLDTSWIPGPDHQGMFRFKVRGIPAPSLLSEQAANPEKYTPEAIEKFVGRVHACDLSLELYDSDDFKLRSVPVMGLDANSSVQMDASEYRKLKGTGSVGGTWQMSWHCP